MRHPWVHGYARPGGLVHVGTPEIGGLCGVRMRSVAESVALPTCRRCVNLAMRQGGLIYLLHFDRPFGHARHYMGWSQDLWVRLACHLAGRGANLLNHARIAGVTWRLVALYYGDRNEERAMKNHGHGRRCPECRQWQQLTGTLGMSENGVSNTSTASEGR